MRFSTKNGKYELDDGSVVFQGHNSPYNTGYRNCFDKTFKRGANDVLFIKLCSQYALYINSCYAYKGKSSFVFYYVPICSTNIFVDC